MRALSGEQFAAYARDQVSVAEQIMAGHTEAGRGFCSCGRFRPCPIVQSCVRTRDQYLSRLTLLEQTMPLPQLCPAGPKRVARRQWLMALVFGGAR